LGDPVSLAVSAGAPATTRQREIDALHLTISIGEVSIDYDRHASFVEYRTCALDPAEDCTLAEDDPVQHARLPGLLRMVV
jgi:hypothetical protein